MKAVIAVVGAGLLAALVWFAVGSKDTGALEEAATARGAAPAPTRGCVFSPGQRAAFEVRVDATVVMHPEALGATGQASQEVVSTTTTTLEARVLAVTRAGEAIVALVGTHWKDEPPDIAATGADWVADLGRPILVRLDADCRVLARARHREVSSQAFDRVSRLAEPLDVALRFDEGAYSSRHVDTYGTSSWSNRWRPGAARGALERTRSRISGSGPASAQAAALRFSVRASKGHVVLGVGPWFESLDQRETIVTDNHGVVALEATIDARFAARSPSTDAFAGADLALTHYVWGGSQEQRSDSGDRALAGMPFVDAWSAYRAQAGSDWFAAQALLRAWLRANPGAMPELVEALRAGRFTEAEQAALMLALARSGSVPAREALETLAGDALLPENLRTQAVSALADAEPGEGTVANLVRLADRKDGNSLQDMVGSAATMTLGTLIDQHPATTDEARAYLAQRITATDPTAVSEALWAIGNSGDATFIEDVTPLVTSNDPEVRAAAAHALRRMPGREAGPILADRIKHEAHPEVAAEVAAARREQLGRDGRLSETELALYRSKLIQAPEPLRREIVLVLGAATRHQPKARDILIDWFPNETSLAVKQLIGQFVPAEQL